MSVAKQGQLLSVTDGAYSSYQVVGFFVVLRDFDPLEELREYLLEHEDQRDDYKFNRGGYFASLLHKGLLLEIESAELHLGDYQRASEVSFTPLREETT